MTHSILWPLIYAWNLFSIVYICVSTILPEKISPVKFSPTLIPCVSAKVFDRKDISLQMGVASRSRMDLRLLLLLLVLIIHSKCWKEFYCREEKKKKQT